MYNLSINTHINHDNFMAPLYNNPAHPREIYNIKYLNIKSTFKNILIFYFNTVSPQESY